MTKSSYGAPRKKKGFTTKLLAKYHGPFTIISKLGKGANYEILANSGKNRKIMIVHNNRLKPFYKRQAPTANMVTSNRPSDMSESDNEYTTDESDTEVTGTKATDNAETNSEKEATNSSSEHNSDSSQNSANDFHPVEKIISHRSRKGQKEVKVRWLNYSAKHDSWVNIKDITKPLLEAYNKTKN